MHERSEHLLNNELNQYTHLVLSRRSFTHTHARFTRRYGNITDDCSQLTYEQQIGWPWKNNRPMVLSEIGTSVDSYEAGDSWFEGCLTDLIVETKSGFGMWLLGGSYYVRDGELNAPDSFGLLKTDWSGFKNEDVVKANEKMAWL